MQANQTEMQAVEAVALNNKIDAIPSVTVPLSSLVKSTFNVRRKEPTGIDGLAENIAANGLLQNLIVHAQSGKKKKQEYGVAGGQRRLAALRLLASQGRIAADFPVDVKIITAEDALVMSMSENTAREEMHPADQIEAFMALVDEGKSAEFIASIFGISAVSVERRLKLANMSPKLRALLREDGISLEQLAALALTDDHETQERVWDNARDWQRNPSNLRAAIANGRIHVSRSRIAQFVGLEAFEAAGGVVTRDLFSDDDEAYIEDGELLQRLAADKLEAEAEKVRSEGWAWVEAMPDLDYSHRSKFATVAPGTRELTADEQAEMDPLTQRLSEIENKLRLANGDIYDDAEEGEGAGAEQSIELSDEEYTALESEAESIEERIEQIGIATHVYSDDVKATAGAFVSLSHNGELMIARGFVRRSDQAEAVKAVTASGAKMDNLRPEKAKAIHSEKLMTNLSAHHTAAVQAELIDAPNIGLAVLAHRLVESVLYIGGAYDHPAKVQLTKATHRIDNVDGMADSDAWKATQAATKKWKKELPKQSEARFKWLLEQPQQTVVELLAFCTAMSIDGIHGTEDQAPLAQIAKAVKLDMSEYWTATSDSYFSHVSKARIAEVVSEAVSAEEGKKLEPMKKGDAADAAEKALRDAGSKWLPTTLRTKADKAAKKDKKAATVAASTEASDDEADQPKVQAVAAWPWPTAANAEALAA